MIALDTNVLVRYLVEDDAQQSPAAARLIESGESFFVPQIVLCELVWVLSHAYGLQRRAIVDILNQLRRASALNVEMPDQVQRATESFAAGKGDFADYLIAERAIAQGCSSVATFDRALDRDPRFRRP